MSQDVYADNVRKATFNEIPELYNRVRPNYPETLINDLLKLTEIPASAHILEIGCGPGIATRQIAPYGYPMLCLELSEAMAAFATNNLRTYPHVQIQQIAFESWPLQPHAFHLVMCAQAWHWIPPDIGYAKAAAALTPNGYLALLWNHQPHPDTPVFRALDKVYQTEAPPIARKEHFTNPRSGLERMATAIHASGYFHPPIVKNYPWSLTYDTETYLRLLQTYSDHRRLEPAMQQALLEGVRQILTQFGGRIVKPYEGVLQLAQVKLAEQWPLG